MSTLYITQQGAVLSKTSERLKITLDKDVLAEVPLKDISQVVVFGNVQITSATLSLLLRHQIEICHLTQYGQFVGRTVPELSKNGPLRFAQYQAIADPKRCLEVARACVIGKLTNLRLLALDKATNKRDSTFKRALKQLKDAENAAKKAKNVDVLRGQEGNGSAAYFTLFPQMLKTPDFAFPGRVRRPPTDPVNALLSFGYTLLTHAMTSAVNVVGFDPYLGYLHAQEYGRPSLPLDLMEEFRPIIVDTLVLACVNGRLLTPADFQAGEAGACLLTDDGRRRFLEQYEQRLLTEFTHPVLNQKMTYQQSLEQQARLLAKTLLGERETYAPLKSV